MGLEELGQGLIYALTGAAQGAGSSIATQAKAEREQQAKLDEQKQLEEMAMQRDAKIAQARQERNAARGKALASAVDPNGTMDKSSDEYYQKLAAEATKSGDFDQLPHINDSWRAQTAARNADAREEANALREENRSLKSGAESEYSKARAEKIRIELEDAAENRKISKEKDAAFLASHDKNITPEARAAAYDRYNLLANYLSSKIPTVNTEVDDEFGDKKVAKKTSLYPGMQAPRQFNEGQTYIDKQGNKAIYKNGQFVPVK